MSDVADRPLLLLVFPTFAVGGAQSRFCTIANHFGTAWRHAIIALDGDTACRERLRPGLIVDYLTSRTSKGDTLGNIPRYARLLRDLRPDVLVTHNWGSIEWAMANNLVGLRHVHIEDGFGPEERARQLPRRVWTRRLALRRATVVLPSRTLQDIALRIWRLDARRVRYVPNGVDLARFAAPVDAAPHEGPPVVGTVAALRPEKNIGRLLRAFAAARTGSGARLVIVGDGPERPGLEALARSLGVQDSVRFAGHLPAPDEAYRGFDVFAMSSDTEQMPLSLLEAMAAGLPVAATGVGDIAALLAEPNRRFVTPLEDEALSGALGELLADAALRRELGRANRARAEAEFDQPRMFCAYEELFIGNAAPGRG